MKTNSTHSSLSQYGYDMVVAVTQSSVNEVMKRYMSSHEQKEYLLVLKRNFDSKTETFTYEAVDPATLGIMPRIQMLLDTPAIKEERTSEQIVNYQELYHDKISYVCKAQLGINTEVIDKAPNIIQLEKSDIDSKFNAIFHPIFKVFNLIRLYSEDDFILMQKEEQSKDEIWDFSYHIKLNYKKDIPFSQLPQQLQKDLKENVDIEIPNQYSSLFDIRALYADFTTAMVQQYAPNIEKDLQLKQFVQTFFDDYVLKDLRENGEDAIFSYSIKPETDVLSKMKKSLVIPGAYKYYVSPYINENGEEQLNKKGLYTINYIVMEKNKKFPELKMLTWNWVNEGEKKNGCMSVNSERLISHLQDELKMITKGAYLVPSVNVSDKFIMLKVNSSYTAGDCPEELTFKQDADNKKLYTLSYERSDKDGVNASGALGIYVGLKITYKLESSIEITDDNQIKIVIKYEGFIDLQTGASHSDGRMAGNIHTCSLSIKTDSEGNLTLIKNVVEEKLNEDIDHNAFVDIFTVGTDRQCIDNITKYTDGITKNISDRITNVLGQVFDNKIHWVLPGSDTFYFNNPILSTENDLVVDLTYRDLK